jgi:hypothetical protein
MDQAVNLTAQAFGGSNPPLTTIRPYKLYNSQKYKELCNSFVSNEYFDVEVVDLKQLRLKRRKTKKTLVEV